MLIRVLTAPVPGHRRDAVRTAEPVTFGIPLPKGLISEPHNWAIRSAASGGPAKSVQARTLQRWPDGTAQWVLVDAQIDVNADGRGEFEIVPDGGAAPDSTLVVLQGAGTTVDAGPVTFELTPGQSFPFAAVRRDGNIVLRQARLTATDTQVVRREASVSRVSIESAGLLRTVIRLDGLLPVSGGRSLDLVARAHFYAGHPVVRLQVTLTNPDRAVHKDGFWDLGDPGSVLLEDVSLELQLDSAVATDAFCSPELDYPLERTAAPFELYQDSSGGEQWRSSNHLNSARRIPMAFRGYRFRSGNVGSTGLRATPAVLLRGGGGDVGVCVRHFWQNFPQAIEATESGLTVRLFPGQFGDAHELQGGEQKTHECWLVFGTDRVGAQPLDWCRSPTIVSVDPASTFASGAVPFLAPLDPRHAILVAPSIDGPHRFELKREVIDEYGWRNFGEIYGDHESVRDQRPLISHYNNQYDAVGGFIHQYLRTADPRWWVLADDLAAHVRNIDIYHTNRDKSAYNGGLFWHTYHYGDADLATHRTYPASARGRTHGGGPSADHNYTTGLMLHHFLTGEEASRDAVTGLAQYVIDLDDGTKTVLKWLDSGDTGRATRSAPDYYGPGRGPANSLNALLDGLRLTGDPRFAAKADQMVRRVVHPNDDVLRHRLNAPEERWFYVMFLQVLGKYLGEKAERGERDSQFDYARFSLLHYAQWMASNERPWLDEPEKLEFPTESWAVSELRKSDVFALAAVYARTDQERSAFLERADYFFKESIERTMSMPTRVTARPLVMALSSGYIVAALSKDGCPPLLPDIPVEFEPQPRFAPQYERAKQKIVWIALGTTGLMAAAAAVLFL